MITQLIEAQRRFQDALLAKSNVVGVAVGYRETLGEITDDLAVVALVEHKKPIEALSSDDLIPRELDGAKTDVLEIGVVRAQQALTPRNRWRPVMPGGISIGHYLVTAGTLGALVYDRNTNEPLLLSNNHVFANSNDARVGDAILQPGATDYGQNPADVVAQLLRFVPLRYVGDETVQPPVIQPPTQPTQPSNPTPPSSPNTPSTGQDPQGCFALVAGLAKVVGSANQTRPSSGAGAQSLTSNAFNPASATTVAFQQSISENRLDAAVARPLAGMQFSNEILGIGRIQGTRQPSLGLKVRKMGRTTERTEGTINLLNATLDVGYSTLAGNKTARFTGQVIVSGMSQGGDSGALVFDAASNNVVGLLFAGSGIASIFTPIDRVLEALSVRF